MAYDPQHPTHENKNRLPVLIVDKKGLLGKGIAGSVRDEFLTVLVTAEEVETHDNVIHIPYERRVPVIPDNLYSFICVVYNGEQEVLEMLPSFLKKAEESHANMLFITSIAHSSQKLFAELQKYRSVWFHVVVVGETFSDRNHEENEINYLIHQVRMSGRIELPNAGLGKLYPILFDDVIVGIKNIAQSSQSPVRYFYLFPSYPYTQIAVARMLQKHNPLLKIDFRKKKSRMRTYYVPGGGVYYYPTYDLEKKLHTLDFTPKTTIPRISQKKLQLKDVDPEAKRRRLAIFLTLLFSLFIAPVLITFLFAVGGAGLASFSLKEAESGKVETAQQTATLAYASLSAAEALVPGLVLPSLLAPTQTEQFLQNIRTGKEVINVEQDGLSAVKLLRQIYAKESTNPRGDFLQSLAILKNTLLTYQQMKAEDKIPKQVLTKVDKYTDVLQLVEGTIDTWPTLLGFNGKKTYLLLFQNNMELRPGGGFIGSYGIVSVENGIFSKLQIFDVYDADGQLQTSVEPPYGLQRYLGSRHWFLRDSNFDPDFITNAENAQNFLKLEMGQSVDGVVAIDTTFLKNLISALGSVKVDDYNQVVTPDNFYLLTQTQVEKNFFPGSTQKKDFLRSLMNAMMHALFEEKNFAYDKLLSQLDASIKSKHVLFAFSNDGIQNVFTVNRLSSSLHDGRASDGNTFLDFLSVVDANVGANKTNYYIKRAITHDVRFDSAGALQETVDVVYNNTSTNASPFGGDYKNYVRFLLPAGAIVQNIFIDNKDQNIVPAVTDPALFAKEGFVPPQGLEVDDSVLGGKKAIGFFFIVPAGSVKKITISYRLPQAFSLDAPALNYKLWVFKQPGTQDDPYGLHFSYPNDFQVVQTENEAVQLGGKFTYETELSTDKNITAVLSKK